MRARVRNDQGASLIEYMLLVVLIAIVALIAVVFAGEEVSDLWSDTASNLDSAGPSTQIVVSPPKAVFMPRPGS